MTNKSMSIRTMSRILFSLLIPLTVLLGCAGVYQVGVAYFGARQRTEESFDLELERLEEDLLRPESYMSSLLIQSDAVQQLSSRGGQLDFYSSRWEIYQGFGAYLAQDRNTSILALYHVNSDIYIERDSSTNMATEQRLQMRQNLQADFTRMCREGTVSSDWQVLASGDVLTMYRIVKLKDTYGLYGLDLATLCGEADEGSRIVIAWNGSLYGAEENLAAELEGLSDGQSRRVANGEVLAICRSFHGVNLIALSDSNLALRRGAMLTLLLALLAITAVVVVVLYYQIWKRRVLEPLQVLKQTMDDIRQGNLQSRVVDPRAGSELSEINDTFNHMMESIRKLKIESYEKELLSRQTQLEYYRLQIRPHFYLNCMKNMYALSVKKDASKLQEYILLTSAYLRHTFQQTNNTVFLQEEVLQCRNYVDLIGATSSCPPELECTIDESVQQVCVPTVSLLTFVENSLKYGGTPQPCLRIEITAKRMTVEESPCLHLMVRDNGPGFSEELLDRLNTMDWNEATGGHVGLKNVIRRFQLIYSGETHIMFYNSQGAVVEMFVPIGSHMQTEEEHP